MLEDIQQFLSIGTFNIPIIESPHAITRERVKRTWRERLFSLPWRPWMKTKIVEKPAIYILDSRSFGLLSMRVPEPYNIPIMTGVRDMIIAHPQLAAQIRNLAVGMDSV